MAYSNVPISNPVYQPELELVSMNGFAWANKLGIVIEFNQQEDPTIDQFFSNEGNV